MSGSLGADLLREIGAAEVEFDDEMAFGRMGDQWIRAKYCPAPATPMCSTIELTSELGITLGMFSVIMVQHNMPAIKRICETILSEQVLARLMR